MKKTVYPDARAAGVTPDFSAAATKLSAGMWVNMPIRLEAQLPEAADCAALSTMRPDCEAINRPGSAYREENKAYCVAVNPAVVRLDMYAIRQVPAKPDSELSMPIATKSAGTLCPCAVSQIKTRLLRGPANAPMSKERMSPSRATAIPPANTPNMDAATPKIFRTSATSLRVNPRSR